MSIFGSRPDMTRIRALAARLGELPAELAACRDTCPICYPPAAAPGPVPCSGPGPGPAGGPVHVIEVAEGELLEGIEAAAKAAGVTDAVIVSLIGTADYFTISTPP